MKFLKYMACAMLAMSAICLIACSDDEDEKQEQSGGGSAGDTITLSLSVTDIADNQATINVSLTSGTFYGAKLVEALPLADVDFDYTNEIDLMYYVMDNGVDINLPYSNTLTELRADDQFLTAAIANGSNGYAITSAYKVWTAVGEYDIWSDDSDAGELGKIEW